MPSISMDIRNLYEAEYRDRKYIDILNGFREHADRLKYVMEVCFHLKPQRVLDIACNTGLFGALISWNHRKPEVLWGVDISRDMCEVAEKVHGYGLVYNQDVSAYFDLAVRFDLVLCMEIIEHVPDPDMVVQNAFRHANGTLIFSTPEEQGDIDGIIHVRKVPLPALESLIRRNMPEGFHISSAHFLPSLFCEKPHWKGWNFVIATRRPS